jgi:hydroxybutyrate-dimer hydrolase
MSFAATDTSGKPAPMSPADARKLFADSSGIPPTGGVNLIADRAANGPILEALAISSNGKQDLNLDSALCFRSLQTGEGLKSGRDWANFARVQFGTREVEMTARLHGKPAIVIHGRRDALVFPNLHSRAYYAANQAKEGAKSRLRYIEVTTGQHFDAFISSLFVGADGAQFAPLHYYFVLAMDAMYAHLTTGAALIPSQVVRPTPRGKEPYDSQNVPKLLPAPSDSPGADAIVFENGELKIPK